MQIIQKHGKIENDKNVVMSENFARGCHKSLQII